MGIEAWYRIPFFVLSIFGLHDVSIGDGRLTVCFHFFLLEKNRCVGHRAIFHLVFGGNANFKSFDKSDRSFIFAIYWKPICSTMFHPEVYSFPKVVFFALAWICRTPQSVTFQVSYISWISSLWLRKSRIIPWTIWSWVNLHKSASHFPESELKLAVGILTIASLQCFICETSKIIDLLNTLLFSI